jgi:hypothetical protein
MGTSPITYMRMYNYLSSNLNRVTAVVLLTVLSLPLTLFASETERVPVLVDPDFVQLSLTQDTAAKTESLFANSKEGGSIDWVTYVIQLDGAFFFPDEKTKHYQAIEKK